MAYDEGLAERIRSVVGDDRRITEKKMFGGVAFLLDGKMFVGVVKDDLMVRVGPRDHGVPPHPNHYLITSLLVIEALVRFFRWFLLGEPVLLVPIESR